MEKIPKVFISYSWTTPQHEEKVLALATRLMSHGVDIVLDKWDLKEGQDKYAFMEQTVTNPEIDKVLLICDRVYAEKADKRAGGVGDETTIISAELYGKTSQEKFIPVIFEVDEEGKPYCPVYAKSRIYIDLSTEDDRYESEYEKLLRNIHQKPIYKKPALGNRPEWIENESVDLSPIRDIIRQIKGYTGNNQAKGEALLHKFMDLYIEAIREFTVKDEQITGEKVVQVIGKMKPIRDLYIDFLDALIFTGIPLTNVLPYFIENIYNRSMVTEGNSHGSYDFEYFQFLVWELFICTIAFLYHYEKYKEIKDVVTHTYFLRESYFSSSRTKPCSFVAFRNWFRLIEEDYKPKSSTPNNFCCAADILVSREKLPVITKESLSFADILLCQLSYIFNVTDNVYEDHWFPMSYFYNNSACNEWGKFISTGYCEKVKTLYGANTVEELKNIIKNHPVEKGIGYQRSFHRNPSILSCIKAEDIGTLN